MKVIIARSRSILDIEIVREAIQAANYEITEVVSGEAGGTGSLGEEWALENRIRIKGFPIHNPQWERGRGAEFKRDVRMAEYADALIAVWDTKSTDTKHMIDTMRAKAKLTFVFTVSAVRLADSFPYNIPKGPALKGAIVRPGTTHMRRQRA